MSAQGGKQFVYTLDLQTKGGEQIQSAQRLLDQFYATLSKGLAEVGKFSQSFSKGATDVQASTQKVTQSSTQLVTSINTQKQAYTGAAQSAGTYKAALDTTTGSQTRAQQAIMATEREVTKEKVAFTGAVSSLNQYKTSTDQLYNSQGRLTTSTQQATQQINLYKTAQQQSLTTYTQTNTALTQQSTLMDRLKGNFSSLTLGVTTLTSGVFNLYNQYDALVDTQLRLDQLDQRRRSTIRSLDSAQEKLNGLLKDEKASQDDIADARRTVTDLTDKLTLANEKLVDAQEDLDRAWKDFAINTVPAMVQTLGGAAATIGTFATGMRRARTDAGAAAPAVSGLGTAGQTAASGLGAAATGALAAKGGFAGAAAAAGPAALAIGALAAIGASVHFNFLGFRDVLNNVGKALGDLAPITRTSLDLIKGLAGQMGISGEATEEWQAALTRGWAGFEQQIKSIEAVMTSARGVIVGGLNEIGFAVQDTIRFFDMVGTAGKTFLTDLQKAIEGGISFLTNPNTWSNAWEGFAVAAKTAAENSVQILTQIINGVGSFVFGDKTWENLTKGALDAANNAVTIIQQTLAGVKSWIDTNIMPTINTIAKGVADAMPKTDPNYQAGLQSTYDRQVAQKKNELMLSEGQAVGMVMTPSKTPTMQPVNLVETGAPAVPQKPMLGNEQTGPDTTGLASKLGTAATNPLQAFFDSFKGGAANVAVGTQAVKNFTAMISGLTAPVKSAHGATKELTDATVEAGGAAQQLGNEQLRAAEMTAEMEKGVAKQVKVLDDMQRSSFSTAGEVQELAKQLSEGKIQIHAFSLGFGEAAKNFLNMQVNTQKLGGEILFLSQTLGTVEGIQTRFNMGFAQGAKGILDWAGNFDTLSGTIEGSRSALLSVADTFGVRIPEGFKGSVEAMKQFISYSKGAGSEFEGLMKSIQSSAESGIGKLGDAIRKGNDEFKDEIEKLEEEWGFEFDNALVNAFESKAGVDAITSLTEDLTTAIEMAGPEIANPKVWGNIRDGFVGQIEETFDDIIEETGPQGRRVIRELMIILNEPLPEGEMAISKRIGEIHAKLLELKGMGSTTAASWAGDMTTINNTDLTNVTGQVADLTAVMNGLAQSFETVVKGKEGFDVVVGTGIGLGAGSTAKASGTPSKQTSGQGMAKPKEQQKPGEVEAVNLDTFKANLDEARLLFAEFMTGVAEDATLMPEQVMAAISPFRELFGTLMLEIRNAWTGMITVMVSDAQAIGPGLTAAFEAAKEPVGQALLEIRDAATGTFTVIISDAQAIAPGIAAAFRQARSDSQPHISGLAEDFAANAVTPIETMAEGIASTIGEAFETGRDRATSALGEIESAANNVVSAVDAIADSINSIPENKSVTIDVSVVGDSIPSQIQAASGFSGVIGPRPGGVHFTVAEAGEPEIVNVIPLSKVGAMRSGVRGDGQSRIFAADGFSGIVGNADRATYRHGNLAGQAPATVTISDVNIAMVGGRPVSSVGGVLGGIPVTVVSGNSGWVTGPSGGFGIPSTGGNGSGGQTGGGSGGSGQTGGGSNVQRQIDVMENGQRLFYYQNGSSVQTNMNQEQISRYVGSGVDPGSGGGQTGGGGQTPTTPNNPPTGGGGGGGGGGQTQQRRPATGPGGVYGTSGPNYMGTADIGFSEPARKGVKPPLPGISMDNRVHIRNGPNTTVAYWNSLDDETRRWVAEDYGFFAIPEGAYINEDYSITEHHFQRPINSPAGPNRFDPNDAIGRPGNMPNPNQPGTGGNNTTGYDFSNIQTSGGSRWTTDPQDPLSIVPMTDASHAGQFKVVDATGKNVAANFESEAHAQAYIDNYGPFTPGGGGNAPGANPGGNNGGGNGQTPTPTTPTDWGGIQTSGGSKWATGDQRGSPEEWTVVPMQDDPSKYKIINRNNGKNIAAGFSSEDDAVRWVEDTQGGDYTLDRPTPGGVGSGPRNPPTTGGGGSSSSGGMGSPPAAGQPGYIKPGGWGAGGWYEDWAIVPMTTQPGKFKVIDISDGKTLAQDFISEQQAQQWIDWYIAHPTMRPPGSVNAATGVNIPGAGATEGLPPGFGGSAGGGGQTPTQPNTPPTTGGGGGAGGNGGAGNQDIQIQEGGQNLYYKSTNGVVQTNMSPAQIARYVGPNAQGAQPGGTQGPGTGGQTGGGGPTIAGMQFPPGFPFGPDTPIGPGGGPVIGGIEFPRGFPFHNTPGAFPGGSTGPLFPGFNNGLVGGFGLPYGPSAPRVATDVSIPSGILGTGWFGGSGYIGTEPGAGGVGRPPWKNIPGTNFPPFGGIPTTGGQTTTTGNNVNVMQGISQTQSWSQSSNIVSGGSIVGRGNNFNLQIQRNNGSNRITGNWPWGIPGGSGGLGGPSGGGDALAGGQYYDSWVVENADKTERHPEFRSNMNSAQMSRLLAMMAASGQEVPMYTTGQPAITGFRYNGSGWLGSRPTPTRQQLRTGRDNMIPIWDTGAPTFPSDFGTQQRANTPLGGNIGGGNPFGGWLGNIGDLIDRLTDNIMNALNNALGRMAININLNNSRIGDAQTALMMRKIGGQW